MLTSAEVRRRERLALPLFFAMYLGIPLLFLALAVFVNVKAAEHYERGFDWIQVVPSLIMLAVGVFLVSRRRYALTRWPGGGAMFGAIGGFFVFGIITIQAIGLDGEFFDNLSSFFILGVPVFGALGWVLGWTARRVLTQPVVGELAESRYDWAFPVRGARRVTVTVDQQFLSIMETYSVSTGTDSSRTERRGERISLAHLSRIEAGMIDASTPPQLPSAIAATASTEPGSALVIPRGSAQLVVPVDEAGGIVELIRRRAGIARR